jgi:hypothetical protein
LVQVRTCTALNSPTISILSSVTTFSKAISFLLSVPTVQ